MRAWTVDADGIQVAEDLSARCRGQWGVFALRPPTVCPARLPARSPSGTRYVRRSAHDAPRVALLA